MGKAEMLLYLIAGGGELFGWNSHWQVETLHFGDRRVLLERGTHALQWQARRRNLKRKPNRWPRFVNLAAMEE